MSKLVFLTGITGHLGYHVAKELLARGHRVCALVRDTSRLQLSDPGLTTVSGDLLSPESYASALEGCYGVIHTAAMVSFGGATEEHYRINATATRDLVERAAAQGAKRFVLVSSRGTRQTAKVPESSTEELPFLPEKERDAYIASKIAAEQIVLAAADRLGVVVISPTALLGGNDHKPGPAGALVRDFAAGGARFYLEGGLNLVDVRDVARATVSSLEGDCNGAVYFLSGHNVTMYELYQELAAVTNRPIPAFRLPTGVAWGGAVVLSALSTLTSRPEAVTPAKVLAFRDRRSFCDNSRAVAELGMTVTPLRITIKEAVSYFANDGLQHG